MYVAFSSLVMDPNVSTYGTNDRERKSGDRSKRDRWVMIASGIFKQAAEVRTRQGKARQGSSRQDKNTQDKKRQDRKTQDKTRQLKTGK